jgi:hypothetical protein
MLTDRGVMTDRGCWQLCMLMTCDQVVGPRIATLSEQNCVSLGVAGSDFQAAHSIHPLPVWCL